MHERAAAYAKSHMTSTRPMPVPHGPPLSMPCLIVVHDGLPGCHQPADYDARPPRSREHPWSCERQTHVFSIAMLFAVETSSPVQRARKRAEVFQQMAELAALQVGHHSSTPAHPNLNKGKPGAGQTCTNISRHAQPVARTLGPDRPLTPDSIPPRRNGRPHGANPNAVSDRVPGSAPGLARIGDDIFEQQMHSKG